MKPEPSVLAAQDRLATWDEVRGATSTSLDRILELCYTNGAFCEIESDSGCRIQYPANQMEFFVSLSDMTDATAN